METKQKQNLLFIRKKSVRRVFYLSPGLAAFIDSFPKRKRSEKVEAMLEEQKRKEEKKEAFEALLKLREKFKGQATTKQIVEWIRQDRRSH